MKAEFTFSELAKIFSQVEKVETAVNEFNKITNDYLEIETVFEDEFAKYDYSFFHAPEELHTMFEKKCAAKDNRDNAGRKAYKTIKDFSKLIVIGEGYTDIVEDRVKQCIDNKYIWMLTDMVERVKTLALEAARKVKIYK